MARSRWLTAYWGRNPWWIPPYLLGRVPKDVGEAELKVLGFVTFALLFEHCDIVQASSPVLYSLACAQGPPSYPYFG